MAKQTFFNPSDRLTNGQVLQDGDWNNRLFDEPQAEYELRHSLESGFYEPLAVGSGLGLTITGNGAVNATVNLTWPQAKGAIVAGIRIASPAQWLFAAQAAGTYDLCLDNTCAAQLVPSSSPNSAYLLVATVGWDPGTLTLSSLTPTALAASSGLAIVGVNAGGAGTVTQVNGVNPDGSGHVTLTPASLGAEPALGNPSALNYVLSSSLLGVRSWMQLAWNMLANIPSSFTPSAHAATHGAAGADPVSPASIGAIATSALVQTIGNPGSGSNVGSEAAVCAAIAAAVSGAANGLVYKGTWNAAANTPALASSTGTLGWFYKVSVAGSTSVDGNNAWSVGDIIIFDGSAWDRIEGYEAVPSVFGRVGAILAVAGDYLATQITNNSTVAGSYVSDALNALKSALAGLVATVCGVAPVSGNVALAGSNITDDSSVTNGGTLKTALNQLAGLQNLLQLPCSAVAASLPGAPSNGQRVLLLGATTNNLNIAQYSATSSSWSYTAPQQDMHVLVGASPMTEYVFDGTTWVALAAGAANPAPCTLVQTAAPSSPAHNLRVLINGIGSGAFAGYNNYLATCQAFYSNDFEAGMNGISAGNGAISTLQAHSGTHSLYQSGGAGDGLTLSGLAANTTYTVSVWVYGTANLTSTGAASNLSITTASPGAWAQGSGTFTTDASGDNVTLLFGGTTVYYDDILIFAPGYAAQWAFTAPLSNMQVIVTGVPDVSYSYDGTAWAPIITLAPYELLLPAGAWGYDPGNANMAPVDYLTVNSVNLLRQNFVPSTTAETFLYKQFVVPQRIDPTGMVTFIAQGSANTAGTAPNINIQLKQYFSLGAIGAIPAAYTTLLSGNLATSTTQNNEDNFTWTATVASLGWTAGELITMRLSRVVPGGNELPQTWGLWAFRVIIPQK